MEYPSEKHRQDMPLRLTSRRSRPFVTALAALTFILYLSYTLWSNPSPSQLHPPRMPPPGHRHEVFIPKEKVNEQGQIAMKIQESKANDQKNAIVSDKAYKVPLEAHIMSKCPDAKDCLKDLIVPAMQRIHNKVNFTLSYIGKPTANDGVECMHGGSECLGNILELCAQRLYPSPINFLGFTMCMTKDYKDIPQQYLVHDCALEHGIDFDQLNTCASQDDGALGMGMLRDSVRRSSDAGVIKSCTVRLDNKIYCVRDGGEWKDCPNGSGVDSLVSAVEKLYGTSH